jgi:type IV pilus assembly protein PilC
MLVANAQLAVFSSGPSLTELYRLFDRMAVMVSSGVPLLQTVEFVGQGESPPLARALSDIATKISSGHRFSQAFGAHPRVFPHVVDAMFRVAERVGSLDIALHRLARYFERAARLRAQMLGGMMYPAGILGMALLMVAVLVFVVFPREQAVLQEMGKQMPALSLLAVRGIQAGVLACASLAITAVVVRVWALRRAESGDTAFLLRLDRLLLATPLLGPVLERAAAARMLAVLASMLEVGVTLTQTQTVALLAENEEVAERYRRFLEDIKGGAGLEEALERHTPFPPVALTLFFLGYEHGQLNKALQSAADMLETELENTLATATALLEPLAMVIVGTVVGILVIATALPTLTLMQGL